MAFEAKTPDGQSYKEIRTVYDLLLLQDFLGCQHINNLLVLKADRSSTLTRSPVIVPAQKKRPQRSYWSRTLLSTMHAVMWEGTGERVMFLDRLRATCWKMFKLSLLSCFQDAKSFNCGIVIFCHVLNSQWLNGMAMTGQVHLRVAFYVAKQQTLFNLANQPSAQQVGSLWVCLSESAMLGTASLQCLLFTQMLSKSKQGRFGWQEFIMSEMATFELCTKRRARLVADSSIKKHYRKAILLVWALSPCLQLQRLIKG